MQPSSRFARALLARAQTGQRHPDSVPLGRPVFSQDQADFARGWLAHVEAGRIGSHLSGPDAALLEARPTVTSPEWLAAQRASEMAVLGYAPSFPAPAPAPLPRNAGWGR